MARVRIKRGILEFSTNAAWNKKIKKYIIECRHTAGESLSYAYVLLGKKHKSNDTK